MKEQKVNKYLKPFGIINAKMYVGDLNLDVAGSGFSRCNYGKPIIKKNNTYNQKPSTYSKPKTYYKPKIKKKRNEDNFTLFNLFLLVLAGLLMLGGVIGAQIGSNASSLLRGEQLRGLLALLVLAVCFKLFADLTLTPDDIYSIVIQR